MKRWQQSVTIGVVFAVLGLASVWGTGAALAADPAPATYSVTTSPVSLSVTAKPGQTTASEIRVQNSGSSTQQFYLSLAKFSADGETGKASIKERGAEDDYFNWVTFSPPSFTLVPNEWQTVKVTFAVPANAAGGYYYAVRVLREADRGLKASGGEQAYRGANAILVLLDADSPSNRRELQVINFNANHWLLEFLPVSFTTRIRNTGNLHVAPSGSIFIMEGKKQLAEIAFNPTHGNVLPKSNRLFSNVWNDGFPNYLEKLVDGKEIKDKNGQIEQDLHWDFTQVPKLRFGHYTAHLVMTYDDGHRDVPVEAFVSFWVIPWRILALGILIFVFVPVGMFVTARTGYKKIRPKKT